MRIAFVHRTVVDYTTDTPFQRGIGGTESALCYGAIELARLGHTVQLLTNASNPSFYRGVECLNHNNALTSDLLNAADVVVVSNESCGRVMREKFNARKPLVMWCQHAPDQPAIEGLEFSRERKAWNAFAFVSHWAMNEFCSSFWLDPRNCRVMHNAVSPAFAALEPSEPWFATGQPPVLVYTSAAYRGLDVLLEAFPAIRAAIPGTSLRVYSSLSVTRGGREDRSYDVLRQRCIATEGVHYVGPVGQEELAKELSGAAALAYPSTFHETSCIAAMEAMAAGALPITTNLGALPETLAGFGLMIEYRHEDNARLAKEFADATVSALSAMKRNPAEAKAQRDKQIAFVHENYTWPKRGLQWQSFLAEVAGRG